MKNYLLIFTSLLLVLFLSACNVNRDGEPANPSKEPVQEETENTETEEKEKEPKDTEQESEEESIGDYFPIKENVHYIYEGSGNEYASYDMYVDFASKDKMQQRINNGGTVLARIFEIKEDKVVHTLSREEAYYRENLLDVETGDEEILLMEPLKEGTSWTLEDSRVRTITNLSAEVSTPSGDYQAIEVTTKGPESKNLDYYVKGIGLVKSIFQSEGMEVSSALSKIEKNAPFVQKIAFYYPNIDEEHLYYQTKDIAFRTNDLTKMVVEKAYKENVPDTMSRVLTKNTKINSLYLNQDGNVYLDVNQAFLTEMVAGAGLEMKILQSLVNTFGHYYGVENVYLTIDNELYASGHIELKKGEFLHVTPIEQAIEIK